MEERGIGTTAPATVNTTPTKQIPRSAKIAANPKIFVFRPHQTLTDLPRTEQDAVTIDAPPDYGVEGSIGVGEPRPLTGVTTEQPKPSPPSTEDKTTENPTKSVSVSQGVQMAKLIRKVKPEYPALAKAARISGVVHLIGVIGKDGTIQNLQLISGHALLARAAIEAVRQWVYRPTLLSGQAVEVIAPIDVNFTLTQ
jgi:protein TonB